MQEKEGIDFCLLSFRRAEWDCHTSLWMEWQWRTSASTNRRWLVNCL